VIWNAYDSGDVIWNAYRAMWNASVTPYDSGDVIWNDSGDVIWWVFSISHHPNHIGRYGMQV